MENIELLEGEIFKPIINCENNYLISNFGRIYGIKNKKLLKTGKRAYVEICINGISLCLIIPKSIKQVFKEDENFSKWRKIDNKPKEIWKNIKNFEDTYQISNLGRVKTLEKEVYHYNSKNKVKFTQEKIIKGEVNSCGYLRVGLNKNGKALRLFIHRLVAEHFIPNIENKLVVNHKDLNKLNNFVENLEWVTSKENSIHYHKNKHKNG